MQDNQQSRQDTNNSGLTNSALHTQRMVHSTASRASIMMVHISAVASSALQLKSIKVQNQVRDHQ
jgi:hypothetical protein